MTQQTPTPAEVADAQRKLDAYNEANGTYLKLEVPVAQQAAPTRSFWRQVLDQLADPTGERRQSAELLARHRARITEVREQRDAAWREVGRLRRELDHIATAATNAADDFSRAPAVSAVLRGFADRARKALDEED